MVLCLTSCGVVSYILWCCVLHHVLHRFPYCDVVCVSAAVTVLWGCISGGDETLGLEGEIRTCVADGCKSVGVLA